MEKNLKVPFFDLNTVPQEIQDLWKAELGKVIDSGRFIGGETVSKFEESFAEYIGVEYCIGVGNGLDAITIALKALDLPKGSNVAVPAHTFIATWLAVETADLNPVGIDVDENGLINIDDLENSNVQFSAVIPVHLHGQPVDMPRLTKWATEQNIKVVEDCAQAHGAEFKGKKVGSWGDINAFSFYPTKNLGAIGDAGCITTSDANLAKRARSISNYGAKTSNKYLYDYLGMNSRLDPLQAAVLQVNLGFVDAWNASRIAKARIYKEHLNTEKSKIIENENTVWHHFAILVNDRDQVRNDLDAHGIATEIHYPENSAKSYAKLKNQVFADFPNSRIFAEQILSLPFSPWISEEEILGVARALNQILDKKLR